MRHEIEITCEFRAIRRKSLPPDSGMLRPMAYAKSFSFRAHASGHCLPEDTSDCRKLSQNGGSNGGWTASSLNLRRPPAEIADRGNVRLGSGCITAEFPSGKAPP
jgi:hypothetical protein